MVTEENNKKSNITEFGIFILQMATKGRNSKGGKLKAVNASKTRKRYDKSDANQALEDTEAGMTVSEAARKWKIPRTTLNDLKLGHYKPDARPGPPTILTEQEENLLQEWVLEMSRRGLPLNKINLLGSVQRIICDDGRTTPFADNRPGLTWYKLFLKRHPLLTEKQAESISRSRGALTEGCKRGWFEDAEKFFSNTGIRYVLEDPTKQFNGDETGFRWDPKSGKILGPKCEQIYSESGANKEQMSVLVNTRADGRIMTSAVVYPYKSSTEGI